MIEGNVSRSEVRGRRVRFDRPKRADSSKQKHETLQRGRAGGRDLRGLVWREREQQPQEERLLAVSFTVFVSLMKAIKLSIEGSSSTAVRPDWAFLKDLDYIFSNKCPKYSTTFCASFKNGTFEVKTSLATVLATKYGENSATFNNKICSDCSNSEIFF